MFIVIQHQITDSKNFTEVGNQMLKQLPNNVKALQFLPSTDNNRAICLWEAPTIEVLRSLVEPKLAKFARNDYYQVNERDALGLPATGVVEHRPTV